MTIRFWIRKLFARPIRTVRKAPARFRLCVEALEDRTVPTAIPLTHSPTIFTDGGAGSGSLRDAIIAANDNPSSDTNTINLKAGTYELTLTNTDGQENAAATGDLDITSTAHKLIIQGQGTTGPNATIIDATALLDRVFQIVNPGTEVELRDLVIRGGLAQDDGTADAAAGSTTAEGGGILNNGGTLTLTNVVLDSNKAQGGDGVSAISISTAEFVNIPGQFALGGGLYTSGGSVTLIDSTLSNNTAQGGKGVSGVAGLAGAGGGQGGGLYAGGGSVTLTNTTLSSNTAQGGGGGGGLLGTGAGGVGQGGGLYAGGGSVTLTDTTLSANTALGGVGGSSDFSARDGGSGQGGGVYTGGSATVTLTNTTLSDNTAQGGAGGSARFSRGANGVSQGGGLFNGGTATLNNTIVANSVSGGDVFNDTGATLQGSHNLIETAVAGGGTNTLTGTIMQDPMLGELAANGGPTETRALLSGSPALNAGDNTLVSADPFDQRGSGFSRIKGGTVDIGAFEVQDERPTDIALSNSSIKENAGANAVVGTLSGTDPDAGDTLTFSLPAGLGDNNKFNVSSTTLRANDSLDFEAKSSYTVTVRATDTAGMTFDEVFTISVTDVNEQPTDIALSNSSVAENQSIGTTVGTLSTTDPDAGSSHTYSLVSGDINSFTIEGNQLKTTASFDFEAKSSYSIRVQTTDAGGLSTEKTFTISVTNVNETPTDIALAGTSVAENEPSGTVVGAFSTTDPDMGDTFTYSLVSGDTSVFTIEGNQLKTAESFNFEEKSSYSIRVKSTDAGGLSTEKDFTISVTDVNEAPTVAVPFVQTAYEDVDKAISSISVADVDSDTLTVTLSVSKGTLTLGTTDGLTFDTGDGTADATMTFSGSIDALNDALASLSYRGNLNYSGADTLSISASDDSLSGSGSVALTVKSAFQQAASLKDQVTALQRGGVLTSRQASSLLSDLSLKGNSGDAGKVGSFLNTVAGLQKSGVLTQAQADALLGPSNILLLSVTRR